jgi:hypothetical protein
MYSGSQRLTHLSLRVRDEVAAHHHGTLTISCAMPEAFTPATQSNNIHMRRDPFQRMATASRPPGTRAAFVSGMSCRASRDDEWDDAPPALHDLDLSS